MNAFVLKMIAVIAMFIDHAGASFGLLYPLFSLRIIGRMAFPIYVFLISEGCRYTKSIEKYMLRLGIFALISEIPYDLFFGGNALWPDRTPVLLDLTRQNVFFTLFLGVAAIFWHKKFFPTGFIDFNINIWKIIFYAVILAGIIALGNILETDYKSIGVAFIFVCYVAKKRSLHLLALTIMLYILYMDNGFDTYHLKLFMGGMAAVSCIALYNGKQGLKVKWFFYAFYPAHLIVLFFIFNIWVGKYY